MTSSARWTFNWQLLAALVCVLFAGLQLTTAAGQCGLSNEGGAVELSCSPGDIITAVTFASYGTPKGVCADGFLASTCHASTSLGVVESLCLGRSACTVPADNGHFGDPCGGIVKALAVKAQCATPASAVTCARVAEGATLKLACPRNQRIMGVAFASYGTPAGTCPSLSLGACHANRSRSVVESLCLGKSNCSILAQNGVFGDPCGGTFKSLSVQIQCGLCELVHEGGSMELSCSPGDLITDITFASYGTPKGVCADGFLAGKCHASTSHGVAESLCLGRSACTVPADNAHFGDPCGGTAKVLAVKAQCATPAQSVTCGRAGEGATLQLSCPGYQRISNVAFASYGTPAGTCPSLSLGKCHASRSRSVVEALCLGKSNCAIPSQNELFGDPCGGTFKILSVQIQCQSLLTPIFGFTTEASTLTLTCPAPSARIVEVPFASYGTPAALGTWLGTFSVGKCHANTSARVVTTTCVGQHSCKLPATNDMFGDPCVSISKQLAVRLNCL